MPDESLRTGGDKPVGASEGELKGEEAGLAQRAKGRADVDTCNTDIEYYGGVRIGMGSVLVG